MVDTLIHARYYLHSNFICFTSCRDTAARPSHNSVTAAPGAPPSDAQVSLPTHHTKPLVTPRAHLGPTPLPPPVPPPSPPACCTPMPGPRVQNHPSPCPLPRARPAHYGPACAFQPPPSQLAPESAPERGT